MTSRVVPAGKLMPRPRDPTSMWAPMRVASMRLRLDQARSIRSGAQGLLPPAIPRSDPGGPPCPGPRSQRHHMSARPRRGDGMTAQPCGPRPPGRRIIAFFGELDPVRALLRRQVGGIHIIHGTLGDQARFQHRSQIGEDEILKALLADIVKQQRPHHVAGERNDVVPLKPCTLA